MKILFLGGSEFSLESLKALCQAGHEIVGVVCQEDKPNLRGNKIEISPVKAFAQREGLRVFQFKKIKDGGAGVLKKLKPDLLVVVSYGQILPQEIINLAPLGIINVHASLLPKYRGCSPIISAILNGEKKTGVTIMRIVKEVDAGDMLLQREVEILEDDNAKTLSERLSKAGAELLVEAVKQIEAGTTVETPQDPKLATFTKMIRKEDGLLDFSKPAFEVNNKIRAFNPNPGAFVLRDGEKIKIHQAKIVPANEEISAGEIVSCSPKSGLVIKCGKDAIEVLKLQAPGGKILDAKSFLNGRKF